MLRLQRVENALLFLTLLFLPTQLGKHLWPNFAYIYSLRVDYLSPTIYFWDILAVALLLTWILRQPQVNRLALNLLLLFLLTQTLSLPGAVNAGAGLVRLEQYGISGLFGVYLASRAATDRQILYLPLALAVVAESVVAALQFIKGATLGLWVLGERTFSMSTPGIAKFDFYGLQFLRPYATFSHPNVLAGYLLLSLVLLDSGALSLLTAIIIFLAMSRAAILVGLAVLTLYLRRKSIIVIMFIIIITIIISPILFVRFSSIFNFDNLTIIRREELLDSAWQLFLKSPVFGIGLNNFIPAMADNLLTGPSRFLQPVHNIFLLVLSETGTIGLIGLISLIGYPIKKIFNFPAFNLLLPWMIIVFLGLFDHYFLTLPQGYRLLFLVWGLSLSMLK